MLRILLNRRREGWTPPEPKPSAPPPATPRPPQAPPEPPQPLSVEQLAEILEQARSGERAIANLGRVRLRMAVRNGEIRPESDGDDPRRAC